MTNELMLKMERFLENAKQLKKPLYWTTHELYIYLTALIDAMANRDSDAEQIKLFKQAIRKQTPILSPFRSQAIVPAAASFLAEGKTVHECEDLLSAGQLLRQAGFRNNEYLVFASVALSLLGQSLDVREVSTRAKQIYDGMRSAHPLLTSQEDVPSAVILAATSLPVMALLDEMEEIYRGLKEVGFTSGNGLQSLAAFLALDAVPVRKKVEHCVEIRHELSARGLKPGQMFYGTIGMLSLLGSKSGLGIDALEEASQMLRQSKGFRWNGKQLNTMLAASLCVAQLLSEPTTEIMFRTQMSVSIQAIITMQMAAMTAATVTASSAAST